MRSISKWSNGRLLVISQATMAQHGAEQLSRAGALDFFLKSNNKQQQNKTTKSNINNNSHKNGLAGAEQLSRAGALDFFF